MNAKAPKVLLIDDDPEFSRALGVFLGRLGVDLQATHTPEDFAAVLKSDTPSVCLIDLNLNGVVAGFSLLKAIRKKFGPKLPLMIISATDDTSLITHAIECGADEYIVKPVDLQVLNAKLSRFIQVGSTLTEETKFHSAPKGGYDCLLGFDIRVSSMDELGIRVFSPHFFCKGSPATLAGDFISKAIPGREKVLTTVLNCETQPNDEFLLSLEFAELSVDEQAGLRKFISAIK